eukprot:6189031-Pleurochrysis_carterae.AAC.4
MLVGAHAKQLLHRRHRLVITPLPTAFSQSETKRRCVTCWPPLFSEQFACRELREGSRGDRSGPACRRSRAAGHSTARRHGRASGVAAHGAWCAGALI